MNTLLHFSVNQQFISQMSTLTLVFQQQFLGQGFVKGEEFLLVILLLFSMNLSLSTQIKHTDIFNQSESVS